MKQCKNCLIDFEPKHETRGHEQLYCSVKCRMDAYKKRTMLTHQNEAKQPETIQTDSRIDLQRSDNRVNPMGNYYPNFNLDVLEGKYQAKTEALEYKLRYEQSQRELEMLKAKYMELENELDEYEGDGESDGYMGAIMDIAKASPELGNALGKLLQNEKVQKFVLNLIPDTAQNQ